MNIARVLAAAALLLAAAPAAAAPRFSFAAGYAVLGHDGDHGRRTDGGAALELRLDGSVSERIGFGLTFTWGLTDWARAREYVDAGNRAGSWTTEKLADVEAWATKSDVREGTRPFRILGAVFADLFLVMTYAAVPICYVGSVGGATSHLELDATGTLHLGGGAYDPWLEGGVGAATLPYRILDWRRAVGPVVGLGVRLGSIRLGARLLWSPPALNEARFGGSVVTGAFTVGLAQ